MPDVAEILPEHAEKEFGEPLRIEGVFKSGSFDKQI
jgi:hypothetical protein